ncbi:MAG: anthranilate synthase component I, partial [Puniceicoccaceae bacterium]
MQIFPDAPTFAKLAREGNVIPVYADLMADLETPVSAYAKLASHGPAFLLESIEGGERLSRYSFIGCRPRRIFRCGPETTLIREADGAGRTIPTPPDPLTLLEEEMRAFRPVELPGMPPFVGGAVGYLGYEYITRIEKTVPAAPEDPLGVPMLYFLMADNLVVFDRARQTMRLLTNVHLAPDDDPAAAHARAVETLGEIAAALARPHGLAPAPLTASTGR